MKIPTYVYLKLEVVEVNYARSSVLLFSTVNEVGEFKSWLRHLPTYRADTRDGLESINYDKYITIAISYRMKIKNI